MEPQTAVRIFASPGGVIQHAARTLSDLCRAKGEGRISVALSGGSTPALLYEHLAKDYTTEIPWGRLDLFFGDERAVPPDHPDSNYRLALTSLLSRVPEPAPKVHRMPAEEKDLEAASRRYEEEIRGAVPPGALQVPAFDLIWLGIGDDGHTASLFPGSAALDEKERLVVPSFVPSMGKHRMTFTFPLINGARKVQFLVFGKKKAPIVREILGQRGKEERPAPSPYPAARLSPRHGTLEWLLDREAARGIEDPGLLA
jgi:6-phosphogluconolactonase